MDAGDVTPVDDRTDRASRRRIAVVVEQHLGHRTYAENLRAAAGPDVGLDIMWVPISYAPTNSPLDRMPLGRLRDVARARRELRPVATAATVARVFNTQVPAVIGPRAARRAPYVLITDVTPRQYDRMADGYDHRPDRFPPLAAAKHAWNRHVFRRAAFTVGWSSWVRESLVTEYGVDPDRSVVIPPGVDTERWTPGAGSSGDRVRYLFVGGDFVRKGGDGLLKAFSSLPRDRAELVVVTKSDVRAGETVRVVNDLGPNDPRLIELFRSSDVFVLPSRSETFGIAAVEASAAGLPVLATCVGGLPDIVVDGETGLTVPPDDLHALATGLRRLLDDGGLRRRLGAAAHERARTRFDAHTNARRLFDLVRRAVDEHRAA